MKTTKRQWPQKGIAVEIPQECRDRASIGLGSGAADSKVGQDTVAEIPIGYTARFGRATRLSRI
jgi:hypothetical protein